MIVGLPIWAITTFIIFFSASSDSFTFLLLFFCLYLFISLLDLTDFLWTTRLGRLLHLQPGKVLGVEEGFPELALGVAVRDVEGALEGAHVLHAHALPQDQAL